MKALSSGEILAAARFNPAVIVAVFTIFGWFVWRGIAFLRGARSGIVLWTRRRTVLVIAALVLLLAGNWVYLLLYLP